MTALRLFVYALWGVLGLGIIAGLISLQFLRYEKPTAHERLQKWETEQNHARMDREEQERKDIEAKRKLAREAYIASVTSLNGQVESKWRADIEAAQASADPGIVPPMLEVKESARAVIVTNRLTDRAVCVSLQRVARRSSRANDYHRCRLDLETCRELLPKASHRFQLFTTGNPPACMDAPLEFRVGTPFSPEPSWWSRSALEEFDQRPAPMPIESQPSESWPLAGNLALLTDLLDEKDRAARWRRELGSPAYIFNVESN